MNINPLAVPRAVRAWRTKLSPDTLDGQAILRFARAFKQHPMALSLSVAMVPLSVAASLGMPWLLIQIVDEHIVKHDLSSLGVWVGGYLILFAMGFLADTLYSYLLQKAGSQILTEIRGQLFRHILLLPKAYFDKTSHGVTVARLTTDFETIGETLAVGVVSLAVDLLKTLLLCLFLFWVSWRLALLSALFMPLLVYITQLVRRRLRKSYDQARTALADSIAYLSECLQGMKTLLLANAVPYAHKRYDKKSLDFLIPQRVSNFYEALLFSFFEGASVLSIALVLFVGNFQVQSLGFTIGSLIVFYQVMQKIFIPVRELAQQFSTIQRAISSMAGLERLFLVAEDPAQKIEFPKAQLAELIKVEAKHLSFRYQPDQDYVLKDINFEINTKERVALVGRTGSGKSTIIKLLIKQYSHYEGSLTINGREVKDMEKNEALQYFSVMNQDTTLFQETLATNIALYNPQVDLARIEATLEHVQLTDFVRQMPGGLDFQVAENGKNLSVGQVQMIGLARAVALNRPLFILDEATATIDSITESYIQKALERIFAEKTILAVAHRLSTISNSDCIYCLQGGEIVESGNHKDLIARKGYYYSLIHQDEPTAEKRELLA